jgi:hypothetical protein
VSLQQLPGDDHALDLVGALVDLGKSWHRASASPAAVLGRDRRATLVRGLVLGLGTGLVFGLAAGFVFGGVIGLGGGLVFGLVFGLGTGLGAGLGGETAWPSYMAARSWLALHHRLPWPLMAFLADAHQRGILRQVGAVYQFRHIELQRRLAASSAVTGQPGRVDTRGNAAATADR